MADTSEEKTEAPSEKRRQDAREKGNVAKSQEINSVIVLLTGILLLKVMGPWILEELGKCVVDFLTLCSDTTMNETRFFKMTYMALITVAKVTLPLAGGILVLGVIANIAQIGFLLTFKPLMPKLEKIDPIKGFQRLFSMRSLVETIKNILKLSVIAIVAYVTLKKEFDTMLTLSDASVGTIWFFTVGVAFEVIIKIAMVLVVLAVLDLAYQRYDNEKKLKMSKQEVKEEHKSMEGDPQIKARIKSLQREMARRRMMEEVPKATVVVTNPTHLAIALRYEPSEGDAPVVIAKGKLVIAQRIKELAYKHNIPVIEDKPLARAMYDKVEIGMPIPVEFFTAVAEILAYVFKLKNRKMA
ncbi:MAG: flagellar biosynthesis protein FlhB [Fibrobacter sp.]|nr:flagellar biosynthesis protein FlhB [Fibrobacter sp.]